MIAGACKTSHAHYPKAAFESIPSSTDFPLDIIMASASIPYTKITDNVRSGQKTFRIWALRVPFLQPMPFLSNFQNAFCVYNYLPYSNDKGQKNKVTHPKPLIAVLYSIYAGAVDRANAYAAFLSLERVYPCRSRFIMRVFQWLLNFIIHNTRQIYTHLCRITNTTFTIDTFYERLLIGMRCLAWGSNHFLQPYCTKPELQDWLTEHNVWRSLPTAKANCSLCVDSDVKRYVCLTCARVSGVFQCFCHRHKSTHQSTTITLHIEDLSLSNSAPHLERSPTKTSRKA